MNALAAWPLPLRLALAFLLGACAGSFVNWAVNCLQTEPRSIGPWGRRHPQAPSRRLADRLPIAGWLGLAREAVLHGRGYWLRPLIVEAFAAVGCAALYRWEIEQMGLLFGRPVPAIVFQPPLGMMHVQFAVHCILISLMLVASLIDFDEKIIPDGVTIPGTLLGLLVAVAYPASLLPLIGREQVPWNVDHLRLTSPHRWATWLNTPWGLVIGLACFWLWCVALMPRTWYGRHGMRRAAALCLARLFRSRSSWLLMLMGLIGSVAIAVVGHFGGDRWQALLSALVGMVASGLLVWMVRIIGGTILRREAMGFGDVTLMCMIGTFVGWQGGLIVFATAPLAGIVVGLTALILRREPEIAFGPYLCLATLAPLIAWPWFWSELRGSVFELGLYVPAILLVCMVMLGVLLAIWQRIKSAIFRL